MSSVEDTLNNLRERMAVQRKALSPQQRMSAAQGVRRQLEHLPEFLVAPRVAGYWACRGELPLNLALAPLADRGQQLYLPRVAAQRQMSFAAWSMGEPVTANRHGIPEPDADAATVQARDLDLVLVPLLAFDRTGHRIGTGGGYYDTSFAFLHQTSRPTRPLLVGVGYTFQEHPTLETREWDVSMDYVVTEDELIHCTGAS
ncbi:5-formyltetrahydrofolate cyclo-ligase [Oleiagrimonas sp.]|uniref:5-formyltetrahydrofolate cyclo-ligase n=1 Tax=Oleiagrimonas sp. TaxID=2010330 RepID=UPI0026179748|nr:5-formyltetrahydrofolate cyclo-ligase [Oleiagrimonas sp.]MDA3915002.1 5-formyltetrahydrofolate cyclo-ligase [Oleiagrimonas sp.]